MSRSHKTIPVLAATDEGACRVGSNTDLSSHVLNMIALEALANVFHRDSPASWRTKAEIGIDGKFLCLAKFTGGVLHDDETGQIEPDIRPDPKLTVEDLIDDGLLPEIHDLQKERDGDDLALGLNFSALHRVARALEEYQAQHFLEVQGARVHAVMEGLDLVQELSRDAEQRLTRKEEEARIAEEQEIAEREERKRAFEAEREAEIERANAVKREKAPIFGLSEDEAVWNLESGQCKTTKPYVADYGCDMPDPYARNGPFTWFRSIVGDPNTPRVFFDASGKQVPAPDA